MNKNDLIQLQKLSRLTPKQIQEQAPKTFQELDNKAGVILKRNITARFAGSSKKIKNAVQGLDFRLAGRPNRNLKQYLLDSMATPRLDSNLKKEASILVSGLDVAGELDDVLRPDLPLVANPVFQEDLIKGGMYRLGDIVGVSKAKMDKALGEGITLNVIDNDKLAKLVEGGTLADNEARSLGLASNLYNLLDSNLDLAETVKKGRFTQIRGNRVSNLRDLALLNESDWEQVVKDSATSLPKGLSANEYATILYKKVERLFPGDMLANRLVNKDTQPIRTGVEALQPLYERNERVFGPGGFEALDTTGLNKNTVTRLRRQYEEVSKIARTYPGLRLNEILDNKGIAPAEKGALVDSRIGLIDKFVQNNPKVEYLHISYAHDSGDLNALNFDGFNNEERSMVLNSLKSYQRVYSFTEDTTHTEAILQAGFHSSYSIADVTLDQFVSATQIGRAAAERYYGNALATLGRTTGIVGTILDHYRGSFGWLGVGNASPAIEDYLKGIVGYQDLFGSLDYCECEWCQSIHSPAAYFVDLMQFIEKYVVEKHFQGSKADDVLNLKVRRPDLWSLPLTCENTTTLIPYLDIINEILESYIAKKKGFAGSLNDRGAVENFVYKGEIYLENAASWLDEIHSFEQPYLLPLDTLSTYLGHFEEDRQHLARLLQKPDAVIARAKLGLSEKEYELIITERKTAAFIKRLYNDINFTVTSGSIRPFDAQLLLKPMGVRRKELGVITDLPFVTNNGASPILIKGEKRAPESVQNDIERIHGLSYEKLDRMHRFVRLWRKTPWGIQELGLVIRHLTTEGLANGIDAPAVQHIATLLLVQKALNAGVEESIPLWSTLPQASIRDSQEALFDRLFNFDQFVKQEGAYPKDATPFVHPALSIGQSTPNAEFNPARLLAGLQASEEELLVLIQYLKGALGITNIDSANEAERAFNLTLQNISLLYRHVKLSRQLKLSPAELFQLIALADGLPNGYVGNLDELVQLVEFHRWWKSTPYSLDELHFIIGSGQLVNPAVSLTKEEVAAQVIDAVEGENALEFADTLFAYFENITEEQSRAILAANGAAIEAVPGGGRYRMKPEFGPATAITIPAGITATEAEIRETLLSYHPQTLIPHYLSNALSLAQEKTAQLITGLGTNLDDDDFVLELQRITTPPAKLHALVESLLPLSVLFKGRPYEESVIEFILANLPLFEINDIRTLSIRNIQLVHASSQLLSQDEESHYNTTELDQVLSGFSPADKFKTVDQGILAGVLNNEAGTIAPLHDAVTLPDTAIDALVRLKEVLAAVDYLGIGGQALHSIVSDDYDKLQQASDAILATFRAKYDSEESWKEKIEPFDDKVRGRKRNALTTYMIHSDFPQFESTNDLYHYFLIDVSLEGCARTSRIVAANSSLQLYIHRIMLNLEQDDKEPGADGKTHVKADDIPEDEWPWRKNYRVWEANRKVFLYPENYIEPELRDNKTPLFEELESELLQQEINEQTVLDAYAKYLRGFDEVGHLKIAGAYHQKDTKTETDTLHLLGVTADEPGQYYYRPVENIYYSEKKDNRGIVWNPWQKINVQIPVRKVSPVIYNGRLHVFWINITTLSKSVFEENRSVFIGYDHKASIEFTTLKLDGTWTPPQKLKLYNTPPFEGNGIIRDPLVEEHEIDAYKNELSNVMKSFPFFFKNLSQLDDEIRALRTPRYDTRQHFEPLDEYTLRGFQWDQVFPEAADKRLILSGMGYKMRVVVDFYNLSIEDYGYAEGDAKVTLELNRPGKILVKNGNNIYRGTSPSTQLFDNYAYGTLVVNTTKSDALLNRRWTQCTLDNSFDGISQEQIARLSSGDSLAIINGLYEDGIIDAQGDLLLLQGSASEDNNYLLKRIGTTLSETVARTLFTSGVDTLLDINTQKNLKEAGSPITLVRKITSQLVTDKIDFKGPYGVYFREIFFHIPFLIANHLNSQGKYAEAQRWYHYIFNPTATEVTETANGTLSAAEKRKRELDRNWRYIEFREIDTEKLRQQLTDKQAIEVYKKDPFNPHALARLRLSAYQKSIVMKYIDNLLDWGDQLFTQDTMESVNEATLLYVVAAEILGERPAELGDCGEGKIQPKTYENIKPALSRGSEFLAELENYTYVPPRRGYDLSTFVDSYAADAQRLYNADVQATTYYVRDVNPGKAEAVSMLATGLDAQTVAVAKDRTLPTLTVKQADYEFTGRFSRGVNRTVNWKGAAPYVNYRSRQSLFGYSILKQISPAFCIPGNKELLKYWDRVEDRLFKIRNCMNIQGQRRQLSLFAPEIDPRLLVRARAAGLSLDDVLNSLSGNLPPYRFSYIAERAKAYVSVVQGFGAALQGALEKKDLEELNNLRIVHQQNILKQTSKVRQLEVDAAVENISALTERINSINYRISYYDALLNGGLSEWEALQQISKHAASIIRGTESTTLFLAGLLSLIPQVGSPFAMKYGGVELGGSLGKIAFAFNSLANLGDNIATSAGLEAGFDRRRQGWEHQKNLAEYDLLQAERQLTIAEIRRDISMEAEKIHNENIENTNEVYEFFQEKFSNLGLYTWHSSTLQRLYKEAFNNALSIARLAEQAYRFERDDDTLFIEGNYFNSSRAGLLAGERLLMALQSMERRYLETNYRKSEIDQAFSLTQVNPAALATLKETGSCDFTIPEVYFDLFYPGYYKRKIQSVRLTIPCVTGPYTNVSATLSLMGSQIRTEATLGAAELKDIPRSRTTTIATSTAQNDSGVFRLNFRDNRYMPFEGAGAISTWKLSLPRNFRQFDYNTINDVIVHISYTAEYDELFRDKVEELNDAIEGTLLNYLKNNALYRAFSLRQEFSGVFQRILHSAVNSPVKFKIENKHFPMFLAGDVRVAQAKLVLVTPAGQAVNGVEFQVNGAAQAGFTADPQFGGLPSKDLGALFNAGIIQEHTFLVAAPGSLDIPPAERMPGDVSALDEHRIKDIILYVEYRKA